MFSARIGFFGGSAVLQDVNTSGGTLSPYVRAYPWSSGSGFGTAYSNPATTPTCVGGGGGARVNGIKYSPDNNVVLLAGTGTPWTNAYTWTLGGGWGTKYTDPSSLMGATQLRGIWSNNGADVIFSGGTTPFIHAYAWTNASGYGTKYSNPGTAVTGAANDIKMNLSNNVLGIAVGSTPYVNAYQFTSGTGFGTKFTAPGSGLSAQARGVSFGNNDSVLTVTNTTQAYTYVWNNSTGFGGLQGVVTGPGGAGVPGTTISDGRVFWSTATWVAITGTGFNTLDYSLTVTATVSVQSTNNPQTSADVLGHGGTFTGFINVYPINKSTSYSLGTKYNAPATAPPGSLNDIGWTYK